MKLIVGLGNPGEKYKHTPHNTGFEVIDKIAHGKKVCFRNKSGNIDLAEFRIGLEKIILAKPMTFMNLSGPAVVGILRAKRIKKDNILVVCDDINLPLGKIRIKSRGSDGGHLGLRSIIQYLGTENFARLRIGIDKENIADISKHVLGKFNKEDAAIMDCAVVQAVEAIFLFVKGGIDRAMNKFN